MSIKTHLLLTNFEIFTVPFYKFRQGKQKPHYNETKILNEKL